MLYFFIPGAICYILSVLVSNSNRLQNVPLYYYLNGISISIAANLLWLTIAKRAPDQHVRYLYGLYWDAMIVGAYCLVPVLVFNVRISNIAILGVFLMILGMVLTKVGG